MLIRFTAENILCFKDETSISLVASADDRHKNHVVYAKSKSKSNILRASAVYGANGHGKTRLVEAIELIRNLVVRGTKDDEDISFDNFKLDTKSKDQASKLVMEFRLDDEDYEYGITFYRTHVSEEWLYYTGRTGKENLLFKRVTKIIDENEYENDVKFGNRIKNSDSPSKNIAMDIFLDVMASGTRKNQPIIKEAIDRHVNVLRPVHNWFRNVLTPIQADAVYGALYKRAKNEEDFVRLMSDFISKADIGIDHLKFEEKTVDSSFISLLPPEVAERVEERMETGKPVEFGTSEGAWMTLTKEDDGKIKAARIISIRKNDDGKKIRFNMNEESSGTRRLLDMIPMLHQTGIPRVYVVDELDRKLHPILAKTFIETFFRLTQNQIIYTTHNTYLLDLDLLRRDEIWFVQKKNDGSSEMYSLAELKIRPDLDVRKGYLSGRFGAIPFAGNISDLGWSESEREDADAVQ